jgi:adenine-specific DNA-methyltransferase
MTYAHALARCYVQADRERVAGAAARLVDELNRLPGRGGYFTETFCEKSRFFRPENGERIDAIREQIARRSLPPELEAVLLTSLMEAADRVDSTTGVQMAYLKQWASRAYNKVELRLPDVLPAPGPGSPGHGAGPCSAHQLEAMDAAAALTGDLAYIDPPYNQHSYLGNYHIWETLARWDKPETYGVACKRLDCRERRSAFNSRANAEAALRAFLSAVRCPYLIVSFSNEGYISRDSMEAMLRERGEVHTLARDYKRYVGAQIGIHNPQGRKVGTVSHLRNTEYLYIVVPPGYDWTGGKANAEGAEAGRRERRGKRRAACSIASLEHEAAPIAQPTCSSEDA